MINIEIYEQIRYLYAVEKKSQRAIARELGISRNTVRRYCRGEHTPWDKTPRERTSPVTDPIKDIVKGWLKSDGNAPRKQQHTGERIYQRLVSEHGYTGSPSSVRRLLRELRGNQRETFIPLAFAPGEAAQVDWGEATFYLGAKKTTCYLFCFRLCYSSAPFVAVFPSQRQEAFLAGHVMAFNFFAGVPRKIFYDNLKTAVKEGWGRYVINEQSAFVALKSHYAFQSIFCNPGAGHEKGLVEGLVGYIRRNVFVPMPKVESFHQLQQTVGDRCQRYIKEHQIQYKPRTVQQSLELEQGKLLSPPTGEFDYSLTASAIVQPDGLVKFDSNRYSVPIHLAGARITVKGQPFETQFYHRSKLVASHQRCYQKGQTFMELEHYLPLLARKPRALYNAAPLTSANLPPAFREAKDILLSRGKDQELARIIKLILGYGAEEVEKAIRESLSQGSITAQTVRYFLDSRKQPLQANVLPLGPFVKIPDLGCYDEFLGGREG